MTRNNKLKCVSGLVNSDTFYKAPLIAKCFIIVRVYPANCFEINIPINFCMVINSCISDIFSKKPLTILYTSILQLSFLLSYLVYQKHKIRLKLRKY